MLSKSVQFTNVAIYTLIFILVKSFYNFLLVQYLSVQYRSPKRNYVTLGNNLVLNVTYNNNGSGAVDVVWKRNFHSIVWRNRYGGIVLYDRRANIEMGSNLILWGTCFCDNGLYEFRASPQNGPELILTFEVIIQGRCVYSEYF